MPTVYQFMNREYALSSGEVNIHAATLFCTDLNGRVKALDSSGTGQAALLLELMQHKRLPEESIPESLLTATTIFYKMHNNNQTPSILRTFSSPLGIADLQESARELKYDYDIVSGDASICEKVKRLLTNGLGLSR